MTPRQRCLQAGCALLYDARDEGFQLARAPSGQRPSGPPDVQRRDVTVADGLLASRVDRDPFDRQSDFDESLSEGPLQSADRSSAV